MKFNMQGWPRVEFDSPHRCKSGNRTGQCILRKVVGSDYCPIHGGLHAERERAAEAKRTMLKLKFYGDRIDEMRADPTGLRSLSDEIVILKSLLEVIHNRCKNEEEFAMRSGPIGDLAVKIEKLVTSAAKLSRELGETLSKQQAEVFVKEVMDIILARVEDVAILEAIANDIEQLQARGSDRVQ